MGLIDILKRLDAAQADSEIVLETVPYQVLAGMTMRKNQGVEALKGLKQEYGAAVQKAVLGVIVVGEHFRASEFAYTAVDEGGGVTVSADALYLRLADRVNETFGNSTSTARDFGFVQYNALVAELSEVGRELELDYIDRPKFPAGVVLPNFAATFDFIVKLVRESLGDSFNALYMQKMVAGLALDERFAAPILPVYVIDVQDEEEAKNLASIAFARNNHVVNVIDPNVSRDFVVKSLGAIKKSMKKTK